MVEKNTTLPFNFYCLSDTEIDGIQTIPLDLSLDLESYWWKICLFNTELIIVENNAMFQNKHGFGRKVKV